MGSNEVNEEGRKNGEEPSVKKSKDKRLEFLNESGYFVEVENSSGSENDEETKYARRGFRQATYQMIRELGIEGIKVDVEHVGVDLINKHPADYDLGEDAGYQSDYPQSDDVGDTEDDEDKQLSHKSRRKEKFPTYNPDADTPYIVEGRGMSLEN
ncbi:pentatricopeptide repeat-containing protein [Corchorus olitorius]|uniref:Pentatricopeptide repeat-containing protein n=1 Tax=Corchorus olitorius TaxID=93759 RepID=A0A1R3KSQ2_9ROSI|nr:pentatricopeptide repeat-containing protein [Corchorus olitorius]